MLLGPIRYSLLLDILFMLDSYILGIPSHHNYSVTVTEDDRTLQLYSSSLGGNHVSRPNAIILADKQCIKEEISAPF